MTTEFFKATVEKLGGAVFRDNVVESLLFLNADRNPDVKTHISALIDLAYAAGRASGYEEGYSRGYSNARCWWSAPDTMTAYSAAGEA